MHFCQECFVFPGNSIHFSQTSFSVFYTIFDHFALSHFVPTWRLTPAPVPLTIHCSWAQKSSIPQRISLKFKANSFSEGKKPSVRKCARRVARGITTWRTTANNTQTNVRNHLIGDSGKKQREKLQLEKGEMFKLRRSSHLLHTKARQRKVWILSCWVWVATPIWDLMWRHATWQHKSNGREHTKASGGIDPRIEWNLDLESCFSASVDFNSIWRTNIWRTLRL